MSNLEKEINAYEKMLPELLGKWRENEGKFAIIIGETHIGTYCAYEDALKEGYKQAKLKPFLVKQITGSERISYFSRDIVGSCRTV